MDTNFTKCPKPKALCIQSTSQTLLKVVKNSKKIPNLCIWKAHYVFKYPYQKKGQFLCLLMKTIYPTFDPSLPSLELKDIPKMPLAGLSYTFLPCLLF